MAPENRWHGSENQAIDRMMLQRQPSANPYPKLGYPTPRGESWLDSDERNSRILYLLAQALCSDGVGTEKQGCAHSPRTFAAGRGL